MKYKVMIDSFEGPLDLLLHLIKESNIDIYDIKIEEITNQYLDYIKTMEELNLSIASEYLVMASELIEMKSKMLLPIKKVENDDEYEEDPKEELIQRLLEYKKYKEITSEFKLYEERRKDFYTKEANNLSPYATEKENDENINIDDLINAFNEILKRKEKDKKITTKIARKELSLEKKLISIRSILNSRKKVYFEELFQNSSREEIIISFLSILEMIKKNEIIVNQDSNFKRITVSLKEGE